MATLLINPNNPLRRQTPAAPAQARPAQRRTASAQAPAQPQAQPGAYDKDGFSVPVGVPTPRLQRHASAQDEQNFDESGVLNPRRFAGYADQGAIRRVLASKTDRMYNGAGEMNAWDRKDALAQAAYLMNHVTTQPIGFSTRQASQAEREEKRRILAAALSDPTGEGFALVGQELALPIKAIIDYEGWIRKVLRVRSLAQGELFRIAKDIRATAQVIGQDGQGVETRLHTSYIQPDEAKIVSFPEIDIMEIYQANFDMLDRAQDTARQEIELEEDKRGLRLLDSAAQRVNTVSTFASMSISVFEYLRLQVEQHRLLVDKFLMNRAELADVQISMSGSLDPVTQRELNLAGYFGRFLGAHILVGAGTNQTVEEVVPAGTLYAVTAPEYLGEMGVRIELMSEPYNGFNRHETIKGWAFLESVGFGIPNVRSVAKAVKS